MNEDLKTELIHKIINLLFISGQEISIKSLSELLETSEDDINQVLNDVELVLGNAGLNLIKLNNNLIAVTNPKYSNFIEKFTKYEANSDISAAQLQVLTIIAYLESVTLSDISFIRGVQSNLTVRGLNTRGLIQKKEDKYSLSLQALEYLGITKNSELNDFIKINSALKQKLTEALNG